jgi:mRNA interferase YafQ
MLKPIHLRQFKKEVIRAKKRGKNIEKLKDIMKLLISETPLPPKNCNHKLKGDYLGYWECHIEPDWLLVLYFKSSYNYF